jgi:single-stranded-DNA-specific exonuclease
LHDTLQALAPFFAEFGGHDQAVGGALPADRFEAFRDAAHAHFAARLTAENLERVEEAELELPLEDASDDLLAEISALAPHGMGNPRPVFHCAETEFETEPSPLGEHGLRGRLRRRGPSLPCLSWSPESLAPLARPGRPLAVLYRLQKRRAGGVEAEIVAARPAGRSTASEETPVLAASAPA